MKELFSTYKLPIIFGVLGLILAVLWAAVGFLETSLTLIMTAIDVAIGFYLKQTEILNHYFKS